MEITPEDEEVSKEILSKIMAAVNGQKLSLVLSILTFSIISLCEESGSTSNPEYMAWVFEVLDTVKGDLLDKMNAVEG